MKIIMFLSIGAVAWAYTDIEPIDVDAIVKDPEESRKYLDCYLDKGPCTPTMEHIKGHIIEVFANACQKCTPEEKHEAEEFVMNVLVQYPKEAEEIKKKYDTKGNFNNFIFEISKF